MVKKIVVNWITYKQAMQKPTSPFTREQLLPKEETLEIAKEKGIPTLLINKTEFAASGYVESLKNADIDFIVLAGFLWKVPEVLVNAFPKAIVNIHPALLPNYGGKGMYGDNIHKLVLSNKEKKTGITFHYVNENYDEGKIIAQYEIEIDGYETLNSLKKKMSHEELLNYPKKISLYLNE